MEKFNFKKKYGQNFLIDYNVLEKITNNITLTENDLVIEIGAGSGNLTKILLEYNTKVLAYEIDTDTEEYLSKLDRENLRVIYGDILERNISEDISTYAYDKLYIIGNLPYYITTPIIEKLTKSELNITEMFFMVQKEVADRLAAKPKTKEYGYITVLLNYNYNIEKLFDVSRNSFYPVPNVESSIIKLTTHNKYMVQDYKLFIKIIQQAFQHKRKTLLNNLSLYDKNKIKEILIKNNYSLTVRAEELPIEMFIKLSDSL